MVIQIDYLSKLPIEYRKVVKTLNKKLNGASTFEDKNKYLHAFVEKYTTLPEIRKEWIGLIQLNSHRSESVIILNLSKLIKKVSNDFTKKRGTEWPNLVISSDHIVQNRGKSFNERLEEAETLISFPHSKLSASYEIFQELNGRDIPKNIQIKYKIACELYKQIEATDINDGEKLIKLFIKTKNDEYIIDNIEFRLRKNPWCQNLWKADIQYLENAKNNSKDLLQVFSRYCRLFLGDKEMKEKYLEKIEKINENCDFEISEFWTDLIKFEFQFYSIEAAKYVLEKAFEAKMRDKVKFFEEMYEFFEKYRKTDLCEMIDAAWSRYLEENPEIDGFNFKKVLKHASFENCLQQQSLPFSKTVSDYILKKVEHFHLRKIYQTCKYFYFKYRLNPVEKLQINEKFTNYEYCSYPSLKYYKNNIFICPVYFDWNKLKNLWLTNSLSIEFMDQGVNLFKQIFSKVTTNNLKYLYLGMSRLMIDELALLTKSNTIENLNIYYARIYEGNNLLTIDRILENFSHLQYLTYKHCHVNDETAENLLTLKFKNKFKFFHLYFQGNLNQDQFYEFLQNNLAPKADLDLYKTDGTNAPFKSFMEDKISTWQPEDEKPEFVSGFINYN